MLRFILNLVMVVRDLLIFLDPEYSHREDLMEVMAVEVDMLFLEVIETYGPYFI